MIWTNLRNKIFNDTKSSAVYIKTHSQYKEYLF